MPEARWSWPGLLPAALAALALLAVPTAPAQEKKPTPRTDFYGDPLPEGAVARMGSERFRLPTEHFSLSLSPDGKLLAIRGYVGGSVSLMDTGSGRLLGDLEENDCPLASDLAFSPDSRTLAALGESNAIYLWDLETRKRREVPGKVDRKPTWAAFSRDLKRVAVIHHVEGEGTTLVLRSGETGEEIRQFVWHQEEEIRQFMWRQAAEIWAIEFSPDGSLLAAVEDQVLRTWKVRSGEQGHRIDLREIPVTGEEEPHPERLSLSCMEFLPDGQTLAGLVHVKKRTSRTSSTRILLLDVKSGKPIRYWSPFPGEDGGGLEDLTISPDGKRLTACGDGHLCCWDIVTGKRVFQESPGGEWVCYTPNGRRVVLCSESTLQTRDGATGKRVGQYDEINHWPLCIAFTSDGERLVTGGSEGTIRIWETASGKQLRKLESDRLEIEDLWLSQTGRYLVVASDGDESRTEVWDSQDGVVLVGMQGWPLPARYEVPWERDGPEEKEVDPVSKGFSAHAFSADDRYLAIGTDEGTIRLWALENRKPPRDFHAHRASVAALSFGNSARRLYSWDREGTLRLLDVPGGKLLKEFRTPPAGEAVLAQFSSNHRWFAWGDPEGRLRVWDLAAEKLHFEKEVLNSRYSILRFSPDGRLLMTRGARSLRRAEANREAIESGRPAPHPEINILHRVLEVETGEEILVLTGREGSEGWTEDQVLDILGADHWPDTLPYFASLSPDGRLLSSLGYGGLTISEVATGRTVRIFYGGYWYTIPRAFSPDGKLLGSTHHNTTLVWSLAPEQLPRIDGPPDEVPETLGSLWKDLAGEDAPKAFAAICAMAEGGDQVVGYLEGHLRPVPVELPERFGPFIDDLDHDDFQTRETASATLSRSLMDVEAALRRALAAGPSPEARLRIEALLDDLERPFQEFPSEGLRAVRAIQVLESIASERARALLGALAAGHSRALQTREATAALNRLSAREGPK